MARWRLTEAHYLNVPGGKWEQKETDRFTGKQVTKVYPVPTHLDPKAEDDFNYTDKRPDPDFGDGIIVCWAGQGKPRDIVFEGDPTPGMFPLDDEAREISAGFDWSPPGEADERTFSDLKLDEAIALLGNTASNGEDRQMAEMQRQMSEAFSALANIAAQNTALLAQLANSRRD